MSKIKTNCIEWPGTIGKDGYGKKWNSLRNNWDQAHRAIYAEVNGPVPIGVVVCHKCDNRKCVNTDHLFLGSHNDNMADMVAKNRQAKGSQDGNSKLTEDQVIKIRADKRRALIIAKEYGVVKSTIYRIKNKDGWKHI
tara:strand:+ start:49 stop:462 length:414 start_codon:yes stop_codon:yes gene_type:complete